MRKGIIVFSLLVLVLCAGCAGSSLQGGASGQSADEALRLYNQGQEAYKYGRYDEALSYHERSLRINRSLNHAQGISANLNDIGLVYYFLGQYEKALSYYEESLKIYRELKIPQNIATSLNNIGAVYNSLGQYEKALSYSEESLKIRRELKIPQDIALSLNNIGAVYDSLGQYEKALSLYEESLKVWKELKIPQDIATSLNNIGFVYLSQKRYESAEKNFLEAEKEKEKTGYKFRGNPALVEVYIATGRYEPALRLLKEMTPRWNARDPYRIQFHTQHGLALKGSGIFQEASYEFLKAVSITEEMRQRVKSERGGFFGGGSTGGRIRAYRGLFSALAERAINPPLTPL